MRSVFIYEFLTAGGCWSLGNELPAGSLLAEGMAMRDALARDFAALDGIAEVHLLHDIRMSGPLLPKQVLHLVSNAKEEEESIIETASQVDATILIAPEFSQLFCNRAQLFESFVDNSCLFSPCAELVRLCSDKQRTCEHLAARGVPTPRGFSFTELPPKTLDRSLFPAVLKPLDGAGSQLMQLLLAPADMQDCDLSTAAAWRLEKFHTGLPVSVSLLAGPLGYLALQPCTQNLSDDGHFSYRGGSTPLAPTLAERAQQLARAVAGTLPPTRGYLGIDIVLGSAENGAEDVVIEINPRLTTSYLGLRQACEQNLAEAMWKWAIGEPVSLTYRDLSIDFSPSALSADAHCPEPT